MEIVANPAIIHEGCLQFSFLGRVRFWTRGRTKELPVSASVHLGVDGPFVDYLWPLSGLPGYLIGGLDDCLIDACAHTAATEKICA